MIEVAVNSSGSASGSFSLAAGTLTTQVGGFRVIPAQPIRTVDAELGLAYDNSSGLHRGRLHLVYTDAPSTTSDDLNIFTRFSDNDGPPGAVRCASILMPAPTASSFAKSRSTRRRVISRWFGMIAATVLRTTGWNSGARSA